MTRFFEQQERARRNTGVLIALMVAAVLGLGSALYAAIATAIAVRRAYHPWTEGLSVDAQLWVKCTVGTALFVLGASLLRLASLTSGARIAEGMGGRLISGAPRDFLERRLLNVVEEMAIASGVPVPRVYVLEVEAGINAFAAGWKLDDAVIAVTRGALEKLTREELQGVIAHEFSHVLNGDMRLNMRLVGVVYGIVCIALAGRALVEAAVRRPFGRRKRGDATVFLVLAGVVLFVLGSIGELCSKLIKAAISRQREFLADASAVQFTRSAHGIAGALRKIGGYPFGARISAASAEETSHIFFGEIVKRSFTGMLATHPPLRERIARLDPGFDGTFPEVGPEVAQPESDDEAVPLSRAAVGDARARPEPGRPWRAVGVRASVAAEQGAAGNAPALRGGAGGASSVPPSAVVEQVGRLDAVTVARGSRVLQALPPVLRAAAAQPYSACALLCAMLLPEQAGPRAAMLARIGGELGPGFARECERLHEPLRALPPRDRLPLVELCAPVLYSLSKDQRTAYRRTLDVLINADGRVSPFEYVLVYTIDRALSGALGGGLRHKALVSVRAELELVLSLLVHAGTRDAAAAERAFAAALARVPEQPLALLPHSERLLSGLAPALDALRALDPPLRARVVDACAHAALTDRQLNDDEWTLLRALCAALHCPLPVLEEDALSAPASSR